MSWLLFESIINFFEMFTSCFFAAGIFKKKIKEKKGILILLAFSLLGMLLLTLRENIFVWIPDFVTAILVFVLYAMMVCRAKWWSALSWALVNYLFIGILSITTDYILSICFNTPIEVEETVYSLFALSCIITRIGQFLLSEIILCIWKRFPSTDVHHFSWKVLITSSISIIIVWFFVRKGSDLNDELLYSNGIICLLVLAVSLTFLLLDEILAKEKHFEEELKTQNQFMDMQMRSQDEVNNMYQNVLSLKHDMNNHLHTISGFMQIGEYDKAQEYVGRIAGEVSSIKSVHSGNTLIDTLTGSKTSYAEMNNITVNMDLEVPSELGITDEDLTVLIGNLYDNAIEANLKIPDVKKRFINIKILFDNGNLLLLFENALTESPRTANVGIWTTTKKDAFFHGYGIKNIDRIVQKYKGYCERKFDENIFRCRIRLSVK